MTGIFTIENYTFIVSSYLYSRGAMSINQSIFLAIMFVIIMFLANLILMDPSWAQTVRLSTIRYSKGFNSSERIDFGR